VLHKQYHVLPRTAHIRIGSVWLQPWARKLFRLCLVPHGMQNAKCQLLWNDEMQNAKIFMGVFSFI
jgi:hypothetical protein